MKDILVFAVIGLGLYVFARLMMKEPILPWKEKKSTTTKASNTSGKLSLFGGKKKTSNNPLDEEESAPFQELFNNVTKIEKHMIHYKDNRFVMMAEVQPVNYFLLDQDEQSGIDSIFETWLAQITDSVRIYLQNRFVDLTEPIQEIKETMEKQDDMHPAAIEYGENMIKELKEWQSSLPRYETKRFILFDYQVDPKDIKLSEGDELQERIEDKAFNELHRRVNTAKNQLRRADMQVDLLTTDGICEVLYYGFNRRKAVKNRYRDIENKEMLALYVTADQTAEQIVKVKGELEDVQKEDRERKEEQAS